MSDACAELMIMVWVLYNPEYKSDDMDRKCHCIFDGLPYKERKKVRDIWIAAWKDWVERDCPSSNKKPPSTRPLFLFL